MSVDEKELLRLQIRSYEFYADLIKRAVSGTGDELPRWNSDQAERYLRLAEECKRRLAALEAAEAARTRS